MRPSQVKREPRDEVAAEGQHVAGSASTQATIAEPPQALQEPRARGKKAFFSLEQKRWFLQETINRFHQEMPAKGAITPAPIVRDIMRAGLEANPPRLPEGTTEKQLSDLSRSFRDA